jgi:hypothetical protein
VCSACRFSMRRFYTIWLKPRQPTSRTGEWTEKALNHSLVRAPGGAAQLKQR